MVKKINAFLKHIFTLTLGDVSYIGIKHGSIPLYICILYIPIKVFYLILFSHTA